jgi:hypothetical protein
MTHEKNLCEASDRRMMSDIENCKVRFFAERNGLSIQRAKELIECNGRSRAEFEAAARRPKDEPEALEEPPGRCNPIRLMANLRQRAILPDA